MEGDKFCLPVPDLQINNLQCSETVPNKNTLLEPSKHTGHIKSTDASLATLDGCRHHHHHLVFSTFSSSKTLVLVAQPSSWQQRDIWNTANKQCKDPKYESKYQYLAVSISSASCCGDRLRASSTCQAVPRRPLSLLANLGLLFQFCVMIWINLALLFSLPPPRSSSRDISSCQSKSAINQSPTSCWRLCLRKRSPSANHRMLHCINAAPLCQHVALNKEIAHTRFPWSVPSWPWAAVRRQVRKVQRMHRPVRGTLGAALPGPSMPNTLRDEDSLQPLSCMKNRSTWGNRPMFPLETCCKATAGLCWWPHEMWCHVLWWPVISYLSFISDSFVCR